jgi:hypothetical protein
MSVHGKNTDVWIDNASGTPFSIQAFSRSAAANEAIDVADASNFGQNDKTYVIGMADETVSIGGTFDPTFLTELRALKTALQTGALASCTVSIYPQGKVTGNTYNSREAFIKTLTVSSTTSDVVALTVEFQRTGPTTEATAP